MRLTPSMAVAGDLPEGVRLTGLTVDTPATLAPVVTPPDGDPRATYDVIAQNLILRATQTTSTRPDGPPNFAVTIQVMTGSEAARALIANPARRPPSASTLSLEGSLGEANVGLHWTSTPPGGTELESYAVRWQRGSLAFEVGAQSSPGRGSLNDALAIAGRIDARATTAIDLTSPPMLAPFVSETARFEAYMRMQSLQVSPKVTPAGYRALQAPRIAHPAQEVMGRALAGDSAAGVFAYLRTSRPVLQWTASFVRTEQRDAPVFLVAWLTADRDAALQQLNGLRSDAPPATVTSLTPPVMLGDETVAAHSRTPDFYRPGDDLVLYRLGWTHGPLVLTTVMEGQVDEATVVVFANVLEAAYNQSLLAASTASGTADRDCTEVTFQNGEGSIPARLCRPTPSAAPPDVRYPAVLVLHGCGGPPEYRDLAESIVSAGVVSLYVEYLAATPRPPDGFCALPEVDLLPIAPTWLAAIGDAVTFLQAQPDVDPTRIGAAVYSLGATLTLAAATDDPRYRALVVYSGLLFGPLYERVDHLPPTLILHGEAGARIPVAEAYALAGAGRTHELVVYPGGPHTWTAVDRADADARAIAFLHRHLSEQP
ncbi:MAG: dienelactone hydrolase family protein [Dehalococcoidia bacterium]